MIWHTVDMIYKMPYLFSLLLLALGGCTSQAAPSATFVKVEIRGTLEENTKDPNRPIFLRRGESVKIDDRVVVGKLAEFFPGLGSGRKSGAGVHSPPILDFAFVKEDGSTVVAYTKLYRYWGSDGDQGDFDVKGNLKSYLEALFTNVKVQGTSP